MSTTDFQLQIDPDPASFGIAGQDWTLTVRVYPSGVVIDPANPPAPRFTVPIAGTGTDPIAYVLSTARQKVQEAHIQQQLQARMAARVATLAQSVTPVTVQDLV